MKGGALDWMLTFSPLNFDKLLMSHRDIILRNFEVRFFRAIILHYKNQKALWKSHNMFCSHPDCLNIFPTGVFPTFWETAEKKYVPLQKTHQVR